MDRIPWLSGMLPAAKTREGEARRNEIWVWISLPESWDQPDNEAASSEGKGRARDMVSCSLEARDVLALSTVASSLLWPSL